MRWSELKQFNIHESLAVVYGAHVDEAVSRLELLMSKAGDVPSDAQVAVVSAPGRVEIGGNHTDHQSGNVLASAISLDDMAFVIKNDSSIVRYWCDGFGEISIDISNLDIQESEKGTTQSIIRGIAHELSLEQVDICGLDIYCDAQVFSGSGLSSSAAFENLMIKCWTSFSDIEIDPVKAAQIAQRVEHVYFGKPCGLMDQMSISVGGLVQIDFKESTPKIDVVPFPDSFPFELVITECGSHANLTDAYAELPENMFAVARYLGKKNLSECSIEDIYQNYESLKNAVGDRAVLKAMHFFLENRRVKQQAYALKEEIYDRFIELVLQSGHSSFEYLQNVIPHPSFDCSMAVALAISQSILEDHGAWRVHGGGFAGTILAFVPHDLVENYCSTMEGTLNTKCHILQLRKLGTVQVI